MRLKIAITIAIIFISLLLIRDKEYVSCLFFVGSVLLFKVGMLFNDFINKK